MTTIRRHRLRIRLQYLWRSNPRSGLGDVIFLEPAWLGDRLEAVATERQLFGRNGIYDVTVRSHSGVIAEFRGRSRQIGPRSSMPQ